MTAIRVLAAYAAVIVIASVLPHRAVSSELIQWDALGPVDTGPIEVSSGSGTSILWFNDAWHLVYGKAGGVRYTWGAPGSWHAPVPLAPDGSGARNPHLARAAGELVVVWEGRAPQGHPEVLSRRGHEIAWTTAEYLTLDTVASRNPVVAGDPTGPGQAMAVWEDSTNVGWRVRCRRFEGGGWTPVEEVPQFPAPWDARDPSVGFIRGYMGYTAFHVAWADFRHGEPEIYSRGYRMSSGWGPDERKTNMPLACRHPSICIGCSGDECWTVVRIAFESPGAAGATEIYWTQGCWPTNLISLDDGIPSVNPNADGFSLFMQDCFEIVPHYRFHRFATWSNLASRSDLERTGERTQSVIRGCVSEDTPDAEPTALPSQTAIGVYSMPDDPIALQMWVDRVGSDTTLVARQGTSPPCPVVLLAPTPFLIGPKGNPSTDLRVEVLCNHQGLSDVIVNLSPDVLEDLITWDPQQDHHPWGSTDDDGDISFHIRAGGCAIGQAYAIAGYCWTWYSGVKSPDVDGDCAVRLDDLDYVRARVGTDDFCADLDGSGLVGPEDVAMVEATLYDHCSDVTDVPVLDSATSRISAWPNPCSDQLRVTLEGPARSGSAVTIVDAAGRQVRRLHTNATGGSDPPGSSSGQGLLELTWDLTDEAGQPVPSGCYFVRASAGGRAPGIPVIVLK